MKFGRKLRRAAAARPATQEPFSGTRAALLMCAKDVVNQSKNAFKDAEESILWAVDVRDDIGAAFAYVAMGLMDKMSLEEWRDSIVSMDGEENPTPFAAGWVPRDARILEVLTGLGFGVPPDWAGVIAEPPPAGEFLVFLKHDGRGVLFQIDMDQVDGLGGPMVRIGSTPEGASD